MISTQDNHVYPYDWLACVSALRPSLVMPYHASVSISQIPLIDSRNSSCFSSLSQEHSLLKLKVFHRSLKIFHRGLIGKDEFLGYAGIPLDFSQVNDGPQCRWVCIIFWQCTLQSHVLYRSHDELLCAEQEIFAIQRGVSSWKFLRLPRVYNLNFLNIISMFVIQNLNAAISFVFRNMFLHENTSAHLPLCRICLFLCHCLDLLFLSPFIQLFVANLHIVIFVAITSSLICSVCCFNSGGTTWATNQVPKAQRNIEEKSRSSLLLLLTAFQEVTWALIWPNHLKTD